MLVELNNWLSRTEPTWLFIGIYGEILITLLGTVISTVYIAKRVAQKKVITKRKKEETFECLTQGESK